MLKTILLATLVGFTFPAFAHEGDEEPFTLLPEFSTTQAGHLEYAFQIFDETAKKNLTPEDLTESHTKLVHLIFYDAALKEFRHLHPEYSEGHWHVSTDLTINGKYFVWAQATTVDYSAISAPANLNITNGNAANFIQDLGDHREAADGETIVSLADEKVIAGRMTLLKYTVTRTDGQDPEITPYLGASAHIIAVSPDGKEILHVHPMESGNPAEGSMHAEFPTPGSYRVWIQLNDHEILRTVALSVTVVEE